MLDIIKTRPLLFLAVIVANILLSAWCLSQDPVINNDGVTYIGIAKLIADGHWQQATEYYSWPYYPLLLAQVSNILPSNLESIAHGLNVFFIVLLSLGFICTVGELDKYRLSTDKSSSVLSQSNKECFKQSTSIILIAALTILLFPSLTKYRSFIILDFAYLSCYIWSLYFIFKYSISGRLSHLLCWLCLAVIGCLFRFESIAFVLLAPYFLFVIGKPSNKVQRPILVILFSLLASACIAIFWWYANDKYAATIAYAQATGENIDNLWDLFFSNLAGENNSAFTFGFFIQQSAQNMGSVAYELTRRMAVIYLVFAIIAFAKNLVLKDHSLKHIWLIYVLINFLILFGFSFFNNFLVSRYTLATALTLLLLCPFVIHQLIDYLRDSENLLNKGLIIFLFVVLLGISMERLNIETNKLPLKKAGIWLAENAAPNARIFSTDKIIDYYAGRKVEDTERTRHSHRSLFDAYFSKQIRSEDYIAFVADFSIDSHITMWQTFAYHFGLPIFEIKTDDKNSVLVYSHHRSNLKTLNLRY